MMEKKGFWFLFVVFSTILSLATLFSLGNLMANEGDKGGKRKSLFEANHRLKLPSSLWNKCEICHQTSSWSELKKRVQFDHNLTGFPLRGRHKGLSCNQCHNSRVKRKSGMRKCEDCHRSPHSEAQKKNCQRCHSEETWKRAAEFQGHEKTAFPLTGAHASTPCESCHRSKVQGKWQKLSTNCVSCHSRSYLNASIHRENNFDTNCIECHTTVAWTPSNFDHDRFWPLEGAHRRVRCSKCHINGRTKGTPRDCFSCHEKDYRRAKSVDHQKLGFSKDCTQCHNTTAWVPANFDHDRFWPLEGAHRRVRCSKCHINGRTKGTPRDCFSCHEKDYRRAGHTKNAFPTTCNICHSMNSWSGASFARHDQYFPITYGKHRGFACSDCHKNRKNYKEFTCTGVCHSRARTDREHREVRGYVYESRACYRCHPTGRGEEGEGD